MAERFTAKSTIPVQDFSVPQADPVQSCAPAHCSGRLPLTEMMMRTSFFVRVGLIESCFTWLSSK